MLKKLSDKFCTTLLSYPSRGRKLVSLDIYHVQPILQLTPHGDGNNVRAKLLAHSVVPVSPLTGTETYPTLHCIDKVFPVLPLTGTETSSVGYVFC